MAKPVCMRCACFFHPERNGIYYMEMMPRENGAKRGNSDIGRWTHYKLWHADLWKCLECGHLIIQGQGFSPIWERHQGDVEKILSHYKPIILICDC